jgi:hypothetical protein
MTLKASTHASLLMMCSAIAFGRLVAAQGVDDASNLEGFDFGNADNKAEGPN